MNKRNIKEIFCDELIRMSPRTYKDAVNICREWRDNNNPLCKECLQYGVMCEMTKEERKEYYAQFN